MFRKINILFIPFILFFIIISCGAEQEKSVQLHKEMTTAVNKWFDSFYKPSNNYRMVFVGGIEFHFCGSEEVLKHRIKIRNPGVDFDYIDGLAGYGGIPDQVWSIAHFAKSGKIIPNQYLEGHELQHLLNKIDPVIPNPDLALETQYYS